MQKPLPRSVGRPRRLTLEILLDEALKMGVENIEMVPLAQRLGVAVGTLYSYVESREHLIFQIASRQSRSAVIKDLGQSWQDIVREHAQATFTRMREWPQLVINLVTGNAGANFGADVRKSVEALLRKRGLSSKLATQLYYETNQTVLGAVVAVQYMDRTLGQESKPRNPDMRLAIPTGFGDYRPQLERMIQFYEQAAIFQAEDR